MTRRAPPAPNAGLTRRQLLSAMAIAGTTTSCAAAPRIFPVSTPVPAKYDACPREGQRYFSVLTWNIFMMPWWVCESPRNQPRAAAIAAELLTHDFDVLCLEKVFDSGARAVLEAALAERYPYRYGPANDWCSLKINSGVWVLSRHPLADYQEIEFDACDDIECFSRKGAVLLSGTCGERPFRIIATHLQGEEGSSFTAKNQRVRDEQMLEIYDRFVFPHVERSVPMFLCGDFGTPRFTDDGCAETVSYRRMLATFEAVNGPKPRFTLDDSKKDNQLATSDTGRRNELDYVLVRANGCELDVDRTCHVFRRSGWDDSAANRSDLSYRYAVSARIDFGPPPQAKPR